MQGVTADDGSALNLTLYADATASDDIADDAQPYHPAPTGILVDSNRDGQVNAADEKGKDTWATGPNTTGALVLPNNDMDNTLAVNAPDNWIGGKWNGIEAADNTTIDGNGDVNDIGADDRTVTWLNVPIIQASQSSWRSMRSATRRSRQGKRR